MKKKDNVVNLFGNDNVGSASSEVERGLEEEKITPTSILNKCLEAPFDQVLVIGIDDKGYLGMSTNLNNSAEVIYILERVKHLLLNKE